MVSVFVYVRVILVAPYLYTRCVLGECMYYHHPTLLPPTPPHDGMQHSSRIPSTPHGFLLLTYPCHSLLSVLTLFFNPVIHATFSSSHTLYKSTCAIFSRKPHNISLTLPNTSCSFPLHITLALKPFIFLSPTTSLHFHLSSTLQKSYPFMPPSLIFYASKVTGNDTTRSGPCLYLARMKWGVICQE